MNPSAAVNLMVVIVGLVVVASLMLAGRWFLPKQHPLRVWVTGFFDRRGPLEMARLVGAVLLVATWGVLTLLYS